MKDVAIADRIEKVVTTLKFQQKAVLSWAEKIPTARRNSKLDYIASESELLMLQFEHARKAESRALWQMCSRRYAIWKTAVKAAEARYAVEKGVRI